MAIAGGIADILAMRIQRSLALTVAPQTRRRRADGGVALSHGCWRACGRRGIIIVHVSAVHVCFGAVDKRVGAAAAGDQQSAAPSLGLGGR